MPVYFQTLLKKNIWGWAQWLMPIILATREAEIRRVVAQGQPGHKQEILFEKYLKPKGLEGWLK
jgi:hypothetical protein